MKMVRCRWWLVLKLAVFFSFGFRSIVLRVSADLSCSLNLILVSAPSPSLNIVSRSMHHRHHHHHMMHVRSLFNCISISTAWSTNCEYALKHKSKVSPLFLAVFVVFVQLFRGFSSVFFFTSLALVSMSLVLRFFSFMVNVKNKKKENKERLLCNNSKPLLLYATKGGRERERDRMNWVNWPLRISTLFVYNFFSSLPNFVPHSYRCVCVCVFISLPIFDSCIVLDRSC